MGLGSVRDQVFARGTLARLNVGTQTTQYQQDGDIYIHGGGTLRWSTESPRRPATTASASYAGGLAFRAIQACQPPTLTDRQGTGCCETTLTSDQDVDDANLVAVATLLRGDGKAAHFAIRGGSDGEAGVVTPLETPIPWSFSAEPNTTGSTNLYWAKTKFIVQTCGNASGLSHSVWLLKASP